MPDTSVLTVRLNRETKNALEKIAGNTHRSQSSIAALALESYVKRQIWWREKIDAARQSELVPEEEMEAFFAARSEVAA
ncbi:MAG: CopG family ribbon-helix-helix protein [Methylophilaceae bacterium]